MDFRFDDDQLALQLAVRTFCRDRLDLAGVAGREGKPADPAVWAGLAELGVLGMLVGDDEEPLAVEAAIAFETFGAHLVTGPVIWSTLAASLIEGVEDGSVRVAGIEAAASPGGRVAVEHADESDVLVILRDDRVELCPRSQIAKAAAGASLDPLTPVGVLASMPTGEPIGDGKAAERIRSFGTLLTSASLVGVAQGALDVAREYALQREQFGKPIGSFQAIKHLLADMYVRLEMARSATYAAAAILGDRSGASGSDHERALGAAKLLAGEAGISNGRTAVQVLGGMGFTWDMLPHYFLKRAWTLEQLFGTASSHASALGAALGPEAAA